MRFSSKSTRGTSSHGLGLGTAIALAAGAVLVASDAQAASGTWNYNGTNPWSTGGRWNGNIVADGAGFTADFSTVNLSADRTVNLDSPRTIGHIKIGDSATTYYAYTLANNGSSSNILTLDGNGSTPTITTIPSATTNVSLELAGSQGFNKLGTGTLILTGANTVTGGISVGAGTFQVGNGTAGSIATQNLSTTGNATVIFNEAAGSSQALGAVSFGGGTATLRSTYGGSGNTSLTLASVARSTGASADFVTLNGTNGTTNKIVVSGQSAGFMDRGLFFGGSSYAYYDAAGFIRGVNWGTDASTFSDGASLADAAYVQTTAAIGAQNSATFTGLHIVNASNLGQAFTLAAGQTVTTNGILRTGGTGTSAITTISGGTGIQAASNAELVIRTDSTNDLLTISTPILSNGTNSLTKTGAGTLTLNAANTYTGGTFVRQGTVTVSNGAAFGASSSLVTLSGATLRPGSITIANPISVTASSTLSQADGAATTLSGGLSLDAGTALTFSLGSGSVTLSAAVSGGGNLNVDGNGTVALSTAAPSYAGTTTLKRGKLSLVADGVLGTGDFAFVVNNDTSATLKSANSSARTISNAARLTASNANSILIFGETSGGTGALVFSGLTSLTSAATKFTVNNTTTFQNVISGTGGFTMNSGIGTLILKGANTYTGATLVNTGKLVVDGSLAAASAVTLNGANASLGGDGVINGAVTVTIGTLAPGNSPGRIDVGSLSLGASATTSMEIAGTTVDTLYDNVTATGAITYGGTLNITAINGYDLSQQATYDLFNHGTTVSGSFSAVNIGLLPLTNDAGTWSAVDGNVTYTFTQSDGVLAVAIPEPATLSALGMLGMALLRRRRA